MQHAATIIGRIFLGLALCLGLLRAGTPVVAADCRTEAQPRPCTCCASPEAGCCSAAENHAPAPLPLLPAPVPVDAHLDLALVSRPVLVILPAVVALRVPVVRGVVSRVSSRHSLQSLLCLRTV